ncbi:TRAP transporter small permease [bacterium]|nr:TRAP transporter small permease [bacterium]
MVIIMLLSATDVVMRYVFHAPIRWAFEFISQYLMVAVFFLALSETHGRRQHISVDLLVRKLGPRAKSAAALPGSIMALGFFGVLWWIGVLQTLEAWNRDLVIFGAVQWPKWLALIFLPIGVGLLAPRILLDILADLLCLITGDTQVIRFSQQESLAHGED